MDTAPLIFKLHIRMTPLGEGWGNTPVSVWTMVQFKYLSGNFPPNIQKELRTAALNFEKYVLKTVFRQQPFCEEFLDS